MQVDAASELNGGDFKATCVEMGIRIVPIPTEENQLNGVVERGIIYQPSGRGTISIAAYTDAAWAPDQDRYSVSGSAVIANGAWIDWHTRRQTCVATSSGAAEIFAMSKTAEDAKQHHQLIEEMTNDNLGVITIFTDSTVAQAFANNKTGTKRSRAIDIRYHHVRDMVHRGEVKSNIYLPRTSWQTSLPNPAKLQCTVSSLQLLWTEHLSRRQSIRGMS